MNIFYLSHNPIECARWHTDKHVVKMILEYAQLLSTAHHELDGENAIQDIYKSTHKNHPSAVWVRQSNKNYDWLHKLLRAVCGEYTYRYGRKHATQEKGIVVQLWFSPKNIPVGSFTEPPPCMPDEYKIPNSSILSYRSYYDKEKRKLHKWTKRDVPYWITPSVVEDYKEKLINDPS